MKKKNIIRLVSLVLTLSMFVIFMPSCDNGSITVYVSARLSDDYCDFLAKRDKTDPIPDVGRYLLFDPSGSSEVEVTLEPLETEDFNAMRALREACALAGITADASGNNPKSIKGYTEFSYDPATDAHVEGFDERIRFYWNVYVNGEEADVSAIKTILKDGDKLEFRFTYTTSLKLDTEETTAPESGSAET